MGMLFMLLSFAAGIGGFVCFVLVLIQMFQRDQTILGVVCILTCGIGMLVAFIYGWMNAGAWNLQKIMLAWTGCWVAGILFQVLAVAVGGGQANLEFN